MSKPIDRLNPFPFYEAMRDRSPVVQDPDTGVWSVFSYEAVQTVLSDTDKFCSGYGGHEKSDMGPGASIIGLNPPDHRKLRDLVSRAFTPRAVELLRGRIREIIEHLLATPLAQGRLNLVGDFTYPLPVIVIAELLGIPSEDREQFKMWSDLIVSGTDNHEKGYQGTLAMNAYFSDVIVERRAHLGDDLISSLIQAEVDGVSLTDPEIVSFCDLLLVAGNETTTNLINNAVSTFIELPKVWQGILDDPKTIPAVIEEVLRYRSPVQAMFRTVYQEVTWGTHVMKPGERVIAWIGSANRDGTQFPHPDVFDPSRTPNRHIAFGYGIHYCLGAPLARLEGRLALESLADHGIQEFRTDLPWNQREPVGGFIVHGVQELPVTLLHHD